MSVSKMGTRPGKKCRVPKFRVLQIIDLKFNKTCHTGSSHLKTISRHAPSQRIGLPLVGDASSGLYRSGTC